MNARLMVKPSLADDESLWKTTVAMLLVVVITFGALTPQNGPILSFLAVPLS